MKKAAQVGAPEDTVERSFKFAVRVVKLCKQWDECPGVPRVLMPQILRSGTSVVSNVEEAQAGQSRADFVAKLAIALKEARETHIRLRILSEAGVIASDKLNPLIAEADEIKRILAAIIISTKRGSSPVI